MTTMTAGYTKRLAADSAEIARGILWRLGRVNPDRVKRHGGYQLDRGRKWLLRRRTAHPDTRKKPIFIVGSNRSGTQMVCRAIGNSPHGWDYPEGDFSIAFDRYLLRSDWIIERLIRHAPAPLVPFGSILDSQFTDRLLTRFENARAIWVYRRYQDAVTSSVGLWGEHQKDWARSVADGDLDRLGPRGERISAETVRLFRRLFREDLSAEDGGCLYWYIRNQIYFDLELDKDPRVLIVNYEDAVLKKEPAYRRIFDFLGFPYHFAVVKDVFADSVGRNPWPGVDARIQDLCDALKARLDDCYNRTGGEGVGMHAH